jgi:hypothetical protein
MTALLTSKSSKTRPWGFGLATSFIFQGLPAGAGGGAGKSLIPESLSASSAQELVFCILLVRSDLEKHNQDQGFQDFI